MNNKLFATFQLKIASIQVAFLDSAASLDSRKLFKLTGTLPLCSVGTLYNPLAEKINQTIL